MTCHPFIDAATASPMTENADRAQISALARHLDSTAQPSGPAPIIETQPTTGTAERIASRCKRMQFRSNEVRKRYLSVHRTLSNPSGDA